jgi:hypothetical protein
MPRNRPRLRRFFVFVFELAHPRQGSAPRQVRRDQLGVAAKSDAPSW